MVKHRSILIVEDNTHMANLLSDILDIFEFKSIQAKDGEEALRFLQSENFDMVITDIKMPNLNGVELLKSIKENTPNLPVVVITAYEKPTTQKEIYDARADGFLAKPFTVRQIEELLEKVLDYKR
ncbi:MAG: hypothetical protein AMJ90_01675 [candidate division Zixibacteria bacterium SM23_73_2]|nr:MAG: hypothetical protein AMJ90_01675 [candidate division Zixibacteria bacterium SM23_73_2]